MHIVVCDRFDTDINVQHALRLLYGVTLERGLRRAYNWNETKLKLKWNRKENEMKLRGNSNLAESEFWQRTEKWLKQDLWNRPLLTNQRPNFTVVSSLQRSYPLKSLDATLKEARWLVSSSFSFSRLSCLCYLICFLSASFKFRFSFIPVLFQLQPTHDFS